MRTNYGIGQLSAAEKSDILDQHKSLYNGYQTMQPEVSNTQPLYVFDPAGDKHGLVVNNKGEVKRYTNMGINEQVETKEVCDECGAMMTEGMCTECNYGHMEEETGHLDDIYDEEDLNPTAGFDYIEGSSNNVDTFKGRNKNLYKEDDVIDDDGFEDEELETDELDEQGGNADDMNVDSVEPAYDFDSNGPGSVYPVNEYDDEEEVEYEKMESAWADEEIDEVDVSGSQGIYADMDRAYDFDSEGPGKGGPYQESSYESEEDEDDDSFDLDLDKFDPRDKSWEEIKAHTGDDDWSEIDEDIMEDFTSQKNKISEMFNRMSRFK
jgi:hypothetical protein